MVVRLTPNPNIFTCYLSELFSSFFQHAKVIQNKFQLNSNKSSGPVVKTITLNVSSIYLLKALGSNEWNFKSILTGFVHTGGLTGQDEGQLRLRLGVSKVHVNLLLARMLCVHNHV